MAFDPDNNMTDSKWLFPAGTRFRLYAQPPFVGPFQQPETIVVSPPPGSVGPGPNDDRMYVVEPVGRPLPYGDAEKRGLKNTYLMPPWKGDSLPPAIPSSDGHFDHIPVGTPEFEAAHLYGATRFTLDIWEYYFGRQLEWHFSKDLRRLELVIADNLKGNAYMGYGFLEVGYHEADDGELEPFSLNFDVIAHEVGHCIIFSAIGVPDPGTESAEYFGFHESAADLTALIASLHFGSVIDELLRQTRGNLYALNLVNRIMELSSNDQIRIAANGMTMYDFVDGWQGEHNLAQPLTGAIFDVLVDVFHEELLERGLIAQSSEELSDQLETDDSYHEVIQPIFNAAFAEAPEGFREALIEARDTIGAYLAYTWEQLQASTLDYPDVWEAMIVADARLNGGRYRRMIDVNFLRRGIGQVPLGPRLKKPDKHSHFDSSRLFLPPPQISHRRRRRK